MKYDLEERTFLYARKVKELIKLLPRGTSNSEVSKQLLRSSGSVGANYIEANESLGKKDFIMRVRISRKEARESRYWLRLIDVLPEQEKEQKWLINESLEIVKILGAILKKVHNSGK